MGKSTKSLYINGNIIAILIGCILFVDGWGWGVSLAIGYCLILLVDIRKEVSEETKM